MDITDFDSFYLSTGRNGKSRKRNSREESKRSKLKTAKSYYVYGCDYR